MQRSRATLAFKPTLLPPISYLLILPPAHPSCSWLFFYTSYSLFLPDSLRVLQWNGGGLRAKDTELLHFISSPVDLVCINDSNLHSSSTLSGFLDSLLCNLIALTFGLAFILAMTHTLAAASSFSSGRANPLNFLSPLSASPLL